MSGAWFVLSHLAAFVSGIAATLLLQAWRRARRAIDRGDITW